MSSLVVNFNAEASNAILNLDATDQALSGAIAKLSSGLAIQTAKDNPAGYVVSQYLQYQNTGLQQAVQNSQEGLSVLNIAAGGLSQINGLLDQMEQLATSSANAGAMDSSTFNANQAQYSALMAQISAIVQQTQFGLQPLLAGSYTNESFQVGAFTFNVITLSISAMSLGGSASIGGGLGIGGSSVSNAVAGSNAIASIQFAISYLGQVEAQVGATQQTLQELANSLTVNSTNVAAANSSIVDVNMAQEMTIFTTDQVLLQSGLAMLGQAQANPTLVLKLL